MDGKVGRVEGKSGDLDEQASEDKAGGQAGQGGGQTTLLLSFLGLGYLFKASRLVLSTNAVSSLVIK